MTGTLTLSPDGEVLDATDGALALLGVSLDELRSLPRGAFAADPPDSQVDEAFRRQWEASGRPDIGGQATLQRLDGNKVRVRFAIKQNDDGSFIAVLDPVEAPVEEPPVIFTAGDVLQAWRAAERRLATLAEGSSEWKAVTDDIESFRARYQEVFEAHRSQAALDELKTRSRDLADVGDRR
jgi:PAS domain-containing protein